MLPFTWDHTVPSCPATPTPPPGPTATPTPASTPTPIPTVLPPSPIAFQYRTWTYTLKFDLPSRINLMKNALGGSVSVVTSYLPPVVPPVAPATLDRSGFKSGSPWTSVSSVTVTAAKAANDLNPNACNLSGTAAQQAACNEFVYTLDYGAGTVGNDPGFPFDAYDWATGTPNTGVGTFTKLDPQNIIGNTATSINWGFLVYSDIAPIPDATVDCDYTQTGNASILVPIDPNDTGDASAFVPYLKLQQDGGLPVGGGTPTKVALDVAEKHLIDTFAKDPKYLCLRNYGTILVTDGASNTCNNAGAGGTYTNCPSGSPATATYYQNFPPGNTEDIYNLALTTPCVGKTPRATPINPRSWVIGVSQEVNPCELNYTAFKGKTDASAAAGDAGFNASIDPNLTTWNAANNYAFFATSASSITNAFFTIIFANAAGDYTTSSVIVGSSGVSGGTNFVFLPSTEFPQWAGHFYAIDTLQDQFTSAANCASDTENPLYRRWDAGAALDAQDSTKRKIYTWTYASSPTLVEVIDSNKGAIAAIDPTFATLTAAQQTAVIDFIRGNDGTGNGTTPGAARSPRLGAILNSSPALVAAPPTFKQASVPDHSNYELTYATRRPLAWLGADDGLLHAFDLLPTKNQDPAMSTTELLALMPPAMIATEIQLYANYLNYKSLGSNSSFTSSGQPKNPAQHIYGVASPFRVADTYVTATGSLTTGYRTIAYVTLGPGGSDVVAIDVTHPYAGDTTVTPNVASDPGFGFFDGVMSSPKVPVKILWEKFGGSGAGKLTKLFGSWSVPATAPKSSIAWSTIFGGGHDPSSTAASQVKPTEYMVDPASGTVTSATLTNSTYTPFVGNQTFASAVLFKSTGTSGFAPDNVADYGLQADLNGQIWLFNSQDVTTNFVGIDASAHQGQSQPIYYAPSVDAFGSSAGTGCDVYAFESGTFYELSPKVSGTGIGTGSNFQPNMFVAGNAIVNAGTKVPDANIVAKAMSGLTYSYCGDPCQSYDPKTNTCSGGGTPIVTTTSAQTQVTAPQLLGTAASGQGNQALFILFDPIEGCRGRAVLATVSFNTSNCKPVGTTVTTSDAGEGAAAGAYVNPAGEAIVAKSAPGGKAYITKTKLGGNWSAGALAPNWWRELK